MKTKEQLQQEMRLAESAVLVVNTGSRRGERFFFAAMDALEAKGIKLAAAYPVRDPSRLPEVIQEAIQRGIHLVIVGGGDGTISSVVDYFANREVVLGILPLGTGNSFARTLGIPLTLPGAVDVIAQGKVAEIDLGQVGEDYFANVATIGFSADVARSTPRRMKRTFGYLAYALLGLRHFFTHRYFECRMVLNGKSHTFRTHQVIIANGSHFGLSKITPDANVDDKKLVVFTMDSVDRWHIVKFWIGMFLERQTTFRGMHFFQTNEVHIETKPSKPVDIDGEVTVKTPVKIRIAPNALKVIAPLAFKEID